MITLEIAANRKQINNNKNRNKTKNEEPIFIACTLLINAYNLQSVLGDHAEICCTLKPKCAIAIAVNSFVQ